MRRDKSTLAIRQRLDQQRDKYQKLERKPGEESKALLEAIFSDARAKHCKVASAPREHDNVNGSCTTTTTTYTADTVVGRETVVAKDQKKKEQEGFNKGAIDFDFEKHQEALEKNHEEALAREFKMIIDYATLPKMILQKAKTLKMESEILKVEVTRLQEVVVVQQGMPAKVNHSYPHCHQGQPERQQRCDIHTTTGVGTVATSISTAGTSSTYKGASVDTARMDDRAEGIIERKDNFRTMLESVMNSTESNTGNITVEGTERTYPQTMVQNENTAMKTASSQLGSNELEGKDINNPSPATALENIMNATELSNPDNTAVEGWNDKNGSPGILLGNENTMDMHLGNKFEAMCTNDLETTMDTEPRMDNGGDDFTATTLETNVGVIEPRLGIRVGRDEYREESPTTTLENTTATVVKLRPGNGKGEEDRTIRLYQTNFEKNIEVE